MSRNNFVLLGTIHDVRGKNKELFSENIEALKEIYDSIYVTISDATAKEFVEIIEKSGINYKIIAKKGAADARRNVLKFGLTDAELVTNPQKQSKELMDRLNLSRKICESIYDAYNN